jgi:hypothetical protein
MEHVASSGGIRARVDLLALDSEEEDEWEDPLSPDTVCELVEGIVEQSKAGEDVCFEVQYLCRAFRSKYEVFVPDGLVQMLEGINPSAPLVELLGVLIGRGPDLVVDWDNLMQYLINVLSSFEDWLLLLQFLNDARWNPNLRKFFVCMITIRSDKEALRFLAMDNAFEGRRVIASEDDATELVSRLIGDAGDAYALPFLRRMAEDFLHEDILAVDFDFKSSWQRSVGEGDFVNLRELSGVLKAACVNTKAALEVLELVPVVDMVGRIGGVAFELWEPAGDLWEVITKLVDEEYVDDQEYVDGFL